MYSSSIGEGCPKSASQGQFNKEELIQDIAFNMDSRVKTIYSLELNKGVWLKKSSNKADRWRKPDSKNDGTNLNKLRHNN